MQPLTLPIENALVLRGDRMNRRCRKCMLRRVCHKKQPYNNWLKTFTKKAVAIILVVSLIDLQLSYVLAFMGASTNCGIAFQHNSVDRCRGYAWLLLQSPFRNIFEKREERLKQESEPEENTNYEEV